MKPPLLQVNNLTVQFRLGRGTLTAVEGLRHRREETLGIAWEGWVPRNSPMSPKNLSCFSSPLK
jgi:hypothetical protein